MILAGRGVSWSWGAAVPTAVNSIDPETLTAVDPSLHVAALISLGAAGIQSGRWTFETAFPILERALAIAEERGTPADEGFACTNLGYLALGRGDSRAARTWMERAVRCFADSPVGQYYAQHELGWIELTEGNAAAARQHFESILTVLEPRSVSKNQVAHCRAAVALCEAAEGNAARALTLARLALDESRQIAFPGIEVMALIRVSEVAALSGEPIGAELVEALHLLRRQGGLRWVAAALTMAAAGPRSGRSARHRRPSSRGRRSRCRDAGRRPVAPRPPGRGGDGDAPPDRRRSRNRRLSGIRDGRETAPVPALLDLALNGLGG